jgi:hypothetical protein
MLSDFQNDKRNQSAAMTLRDDIAAASAAAPETDFHFVRVHRFKPILERIAERFLRGGKQDLRFVWLWERFRHQTASSHPSDALGVLESRLQQEERYWFLASDEHGKYWVADASGRGVLGALRAMYHFEYYVVDRHMNWLICENHHRMLIEAAAVTDPSCECRGC